MTMRDSRQKLALSCTFGMRNGQLVQLDEAALDFQNQVQLGRGGLVDAKYEIVRLLGHGGMGAIYEVRHVLLQKDMALKTFRSQSLSAESWQRFQREAKAIARLKHKNIVEVFDFGITQSNMPYYTMELLEGESLAEVLERVGRMRPVEAFKIFVQAAEALAHAHRHQIVHRDIKPANIFLLKERGARPGEFLVKIVDFGIAKLAEDISEDAPEAQSLTRGGVVFGSCLYMSPEQSLGRPVDSRTDIYSFGCALFEALVGEPLFLEESAIDTLNNHQTKAPPKLSTVVPGGRLPHRTDVLMDRLLAKNPDHRFQTFEEVVDELHACVESVMAASGAETVEMRTRSVEERERNPDRFRTGLLDSALSLGGDDDDDGGDDDADDGSRARGLHRSLPGLSTGTILFIIVVLLVVGGGSGYVFWRQHQMAEEASPPPVVSDDKAAAKRERKALKRGYPYFSDREKMLDGMKPYLTQTTASSREFIFPVQSIGKMRDGYENVPVECEGHVSVSRGDDLYFFAGDEVFKTPQLLERFGPDDLYFLKFDTLYEGSWNNEHLSHICGFKYLRDLNLSDLKSVDGNAIAYLNQLDRLTSLDLSNTSIDGAALAKSSVLPQLTKLKMNAITHGSDLFKFMADQPGKFKLNELEAKGVGITDGDLKYIGTLTKLHELSLGGNRIKGSGLKYLAAMPSLIYLYLGSNSLDHSALEGLGKLHSLKHLEINAGIFSEEELAHLQATMPDCKIVSKPVDRNGRAVKWNDQR